MTATRARLPIHDVLGELRARLRAAPNAVLVAPPGAGKTTIVPLALADEPWARGGRLIVLEPRRLAARAAAGRMADSRGEAVGDFVGLRVRLGSKISAATRVEIVTEGVFARMILGDPSLEGVAGVLFDEFHERSLDADLGLALALDAQAALRPDLRLLVMSATLDGGRVASLMGEAAVISGEGRAHPVETRYLGRDPRKTIEDEMARAILSALAEEEGSILAFLPGQGEILRLADRLGERLAGRPVDLAPLYGAMDRAAQDRAILPAPPGRRKVVLATPIAETSLTIEGVRVVVDGGLRRAPRFEPELGLTRLETTRVSRAGADQRRGRAGRTGPGLCLRLWDEAQTRALAPFETPEILAADLSGFALDLAEWGVRDAGGLAFLDPPPPGALAGARAMLRSLGAMDADGRITDEGRAIRALPLAPRLARMALEAARAGAADAGAELAVVLTERGLGGEAIDASERLERLRREKGARAGDARRLAREWARRAASQAGEGRGAFEGADDPGRLIALAFPDRIAGARGKPGEFLMANGRAARLDPHERLAREPFLAIAEIAGRAGSARILSAAALTPEALREVAGAAIETREETVFDPATASLRGRRVTRLGAIILAETTLPVAAGPESARMLAEGLAALGVGRLPFTPAQRQTRARVAFLRRVAGGPWPDLSDVALAAGAADWLAPFLEGKTSLAAVGADDLEAALRALLPHRLRERLDVEAPTHFEAPTGTRAPVDYGAEGGPAIAIRVQELFGLSVHPSLAGGRLPLTLELLSPAHRPIQITRDLPGFWRGSWASVRADMRGRYPRHPWPENPAGAAPTRRAKPRGT